MADEYRFLRFESVGITTIIFLIIGILPVIPISVIESCSRDISGVAAVVGIILLLSLPLGYVSHQVIVNKYRSHTKPRQAHTIIEKMFNEQSNKHYKKDFFDESFCPMQKIAFITSMIDLILYNKENKTNIEIHERLSSLWSHFYARKAVGSYSQNISFALNTGIYLVLHFLKITTITSRMVILSLIWHGVILIIGRHFINPYSVKIFLELEYLETEIILSNLIEINKIIKPIVLNYGKYI